MRGPGVLSRVNESHASLIWIMTSSTRVTYRREGLIDQDLPPFDWWSGCWHGPDEMFEWLSVVIARRVQCKTAIIDFGFNHLTAHRRVSGFTKFSRNANFVAEHGKSQTRLVHYPHTKLAFKLHCQVRNSELLRFATLGDWASKSGLVPRKWENTLLTILFIIRKQIKKERTTSTWLPLAAAIC